MSDILFKGLFDSSAARVISLPDFILCVVTALLLGLFSAFTYSRKSRCTKSFITALAVLPAVVCVIIMAVNGNIGAGVAIAGAFGLVRFRSAAGTAREISAVFLAMASGILAGMGYIGFAVLFTVLLCAVLMLYDRVDLSAKINKKKYKTLSIVIPEDLDYTGVFDDIFAEHTESCELTQVKTTNMGSLFRLTYNVVLKNGASEKEMIDKLRCRNGNLEISISEQATALAEL